ncbi:hypothetical protein [Bradyrhizobium elkanii]|uniref:hypothetical protein n=1 Tax=Bradyrhizobium elkanii TaxID=29448 RepID=UPI002168B992|nr:hypothetical protein [Bradyrhizobium elkanii]MCS3690944.1 hypothetical protein [Bradyrhizobium elkanii]
MDNAGSYSLASLQISAAKSLSLLTPIQNLDGMSSVSIEASFSYGSAGSTCSAIVATSYDEGTTWRHVARFDFTTSTSVKIANVQAIAAKAVGAYTDLGSEGVNDGALGSWLAVYVVSTGTYANTVLSVRAAVR